jgi:pyruvate kinase
VKVMLEVIEKTEGSIDFNQWPLRQKASDGEIYDAIGHAACTLSCDLKVKAILCCTFSGFTAQMLSKYRPPVPIYAFTPSEFIRNKMNLIWGVYPFLTRYTDSIDELINECVRILKEKGLVQIGDLVIFIAGLPLKEASETNFIKLHQIR